LDLRDPDDPGASLREIKERLRRVPRRGIGYGLLRWAGPVEIAAELAALPRSEVLFNYFGQLDRGLPEEPLFAAAPESRGPLRASENRRLHALEIEASIAGGIFQTRWTYSAVLHRPATIERLATAFLQALRDLIEHGRSCTVAEYTLSDFPDVSLTEEQLHQALAEIDLE
jgi:non-ribosomal peptide synthase protein (TIGR01720 family)